MTTHGHTLVWHQQTPSWFFEGGDRDIVVQRLKDHIEKVVGRYKGRLQSWDVVNNHPKPAYTAIVGQAKK